MCFSFTSMDRYKIIDIKYVEAGAFSETITYYALNEEYKKKELKNYDTNIYDYEELENGYRYTFMGCDVETEYC